MIGPNGVCGIGRAWCASLLGIVLLAGCATTRPPPRPPVAPEQRAAAEARQAERERQLRAMPQWRMSGRLAVTSGRQGGSGRVDWTQQGSTFQVAVSAPITRQSWRLRVDDEVAVLEGLPGGPRQGRDAAALLYESTGWDVPVVALADWMRGLRAPGFGPARMQFAADGRLAQLEQGGWSIAYHWPESTTASAETAEVPMPRRLDATRGGARVRLLIDEWLDPATSTTGNP